MWSAGHLVFLSHCPKKADRRSSMSENQASKVQEKNPDKETSISEGTISNSASEKFDEGSIGELKEEEDIPKNIPAADDSSSRINKNDLESAGFTLDEFASLLSKYDYNFKPGDIVNGTVFALESKGAMIDIGAKTAAFMPMQEVSINRVEGLSDVLQPSEIREFFIMTEENEDGQLSLSIRRIEYQRAWERVRQLQKEDATIYSEVFATNRGGALVRVEGLRGFIPGSHISTRKAKEELVADFLPLKFLEVDEERNRLVLSHRRALVERKMNRLEVGEVVVGAVRGIKPYGAFIDIGGVSGLLHISEISHEHIETPHSVLNVNDQMKVMIIDLDAERGRISLSTKALEPEPGDMLTDPQKVFDKAEEMAARYKQMLLEQAEEGEDPIAVMTI